MLYLEAVRQLRGELGADETFLIHTTLVPYLETTGEQKTKPTQHSVKELRETGLEADMIVARTKKELEKSSREKISLFCDVKEEAVISDPNVDTVYQIPLVFDQQNVDTIVADKLGIETNENDLGDWKKRVENVLSEPLAKIAICGKYMDMEDSYASVEEALKHAAADIGGSVEIEYVDTEDFHPEDLEEMDGVIIPGGFGERGVEGKIDAIKYCRENNKPILGLCYGMQLMVIESARNQCGIEDAISDEWSRDGEPVIAELPGQKDVEQMGGTMRLGSFTAELKGRVKEIYGSDEASERHRHRYEVDPDIHSVLEENGLIISGLMKEGTLAEYVERDDHQFFIGTQAHPEFNSSFQKPNPLYRAFVDASI